ncbi:MAG TPA: C4-type zinc ribbon domain-containing protein [Verrucomicrobiota bacterium]|nr:hypothetical protein [Verrucomicrobiales bacterium]HRI11436.1 C4-type zinc ribbon domain-containing protein [Verrucomicrobiota bacterium]
MLPVIERLLVLQDRDRKRLRLETELADLPLQRRRLQERAARNAAAADDLKQRTRHLESERKRLELEVKSKEEFIRKIETQQGATKSNEEYRRFTHQIDTTRSEITALEDQELVLMEQAETATRELAAAAQLAATEKATVDKLISDLAAREGNLTADLAAIRGDRQRLAADVDPGTLSKYDRLVEKRGDNVVVGVTGAICGGCHMKLTQQDFLKAKAQQELVFCPNCTRILYYTRDMEP